MAQFTGIVVCARIQLAIQDQSRPKACSKGHEYHIPGAFAGTEKPFCKGAGIRIVVDCRRYSEFFGEYPYDGDIVPAGKIRRRHYHTGPAVQGTAAADADGADTFGAQAVPFNDFPESGLYVPDGTLHIGRGKAQLVLDYDSTRFRKAEGNGTFGTPDVDTGQ